ncbi:hypothetical protein NKR23_g4177 [Pleurostoma richardsiae]|uniref:HXXEE domain-containing protein n=1 Tax=Pleurostoma richardsiae TaxID=41990 RepID=A0AA38RWV2_9PEZI|nr:hypothetical protein NKR23_g4177 [Pleurostoma richardsiae]
MPGWYWSNWYNVNAGVAVLSWSILAAYWDRFDLVQRLLIADFGVMNLHHWEEFGFPGGFPNMCNACRFHSDRPTHYPLNALAAAFGNNWFNYFVYLPPLFFPNVTWLTLCPLAFGLLEVLVHAIAFNALIKCFYNPGLATSVFGFLPIGVIYLKHAYTNNLLGVMDWVWAVTYAMTNYYVIFYTIGINIMGSKDTPYYFTKEEMERFNPSAWWPRPLLAFYREHWYNFTALAFVIGSFFMGFFGNLFSPIQTILIYNLLALFVHQVEEYLLPGGGPLIINAVLYGEKKDYDRYPGNKMSMVWVNTLAYPFYVAAIVYPDKIWLGLAQSFFGFIQVLGHCLQINIKGNMGYNPGVASALLLHMPIGIYYIAYVQEHHLIGSSDWFNSLGALVAAVVLIIPLPILAFRDRRSPYALSEKEMNRFNMLNKLKAMGCISKTE